jgi:hypothetical protein
MALGAGGLLVGVAALLMALKQVGLVGGEGPGASPAMPAVVLPPEVQAPVTQAPVTQAPAAQVATAQAAASAAPPAGPQVSAGGAKAAAGPHTNLLDPEAGGKLVIANQDGWRQVMERDLRTTVLSARGFAVFAFRDEKPAEIDAVAVYVESTSGYNLKELAIYAADQSETGPSRKVAALSVPNYRNMRAPLHEFKVDPFTARYVKLELVSWQDGSGLPNGYVGNLQLLGALK